MIEHSSADRAGVLTFVYARHRRRRTAQGSLRDRAQQIKDGVRWRTLPYKAPPAYLWEVLARVYGQRLNRIAYLYARSRVRLTTPSKKDETRWSMQSVGAGEALRFELSQRYSLFRGDIRPARERLDSVLAELESDGMVIVDRPALFLTRRGERAAASLTKGIEQVAS